MCTGNGTERSESLSLEGKLVLTQHAHFARAECRIVRHCWEKKSATASLPKLGQTCSGLGPQ